MIKIHMMPLLTFGVCIGFITGCATVALQPGAEHLKVIHSPAPQSCHWKGSVVSEDTNGVTQTYTSHDHLQIDEFNTLRNKAFAQGANVLVMTQHQTTYGKYGRRREFILLHEHRLAGQAYQCDAKTFNQLRSVPLTDFSDTSH